MLDAYSGTGAVGLEALSRGAANVTFLEANPELAREIVRTAQRFGVERQATVIAGPVVSALTGRLGRGAVFDLILADPPYGGTEMGGFLRAASVHLGGAGLVVLERDLRDDPAPDLPVGLARARTARYGRTCLDFFEKRPDSVPPADAGD